MFSNRTYNALALAAFVAVGIYLPDIQSSRNLAEDVSTTHD